MTENRIALHFQLLQKQLAALVTHVIVKRGGNLDCHLGPFLQICILFGSRDFFSDNQCQKSLINCDSMLCINSKAKHEKD